MRSEPEGEGIYDRALFLPAKTMQCVVGFMIDHCPRTDYLSRFTKPYYCRFLNRYNQSDSDEGLITAGFRTDSDKVFRKPKNKMKKELKK